MTIDYQWLDSSEQVAELDRQWSLDQPLFVDTEFMRERTYWPQLALVQIRCGDGPSASNWLIDPSNMSDTAPLTSLLSRRTLVMHGCSEDLETFKAWSGFFPASLEDTQVAGAFVGYDLQCGYQKMVESVHGVSLPKTATRTNWLRRPLSQEQLEYAVQDVIYLPAIRDTLLEKMRTNDRLGWWQEECQRMIDDARRDTDPDSLWKQVKGAGSLDEFGRRNLLQVAAWRDEVARKVDQPRSFIIKDAELLTIVQARNVSSRSLFDLGAHPSFVRKYGDQLMEQLALASQREAPAALPGMPDPAQRALHKRLRACVAGIAESLSITPEILARRRWIEALARDPADIPEAMRGWRRELVVEPLLEIIQ